MNRLRRGRVGLAVLLIGAIVLPVWTPALAEFGAVGGAAVEIAPPPSVQRNALTSAEHLFAFDERQHVTLPSSIVVDLSQPGTYGNGNATKTPTTLAAGTVVDSHFVHGDPGGATNVDVSATFGFAQPVLGVVVGDGRLDASDFLGPAGTDYPGGLGARGLELAASDVVTLSADRRTVDLDLGLATRVDQVRIITASAGPAELTGTVAGPPVACPGKTVGTSITGSVTNTGATSAAPTSAGLYLSADDVITTADLLVQHVPVPGLAPSATAALNVSPSATYPSGLPPGRAFLGLIVDENGAVTEADETNNTNSAPIALFCGAARIGGLSLVSAPTEIAAGSFRLPVDAVPLEAITFSATGVEDQTAAELTATGLPGRLLPGRLLPGRLLPGRLLLVQLPSGVLEEIHLSDLPVAGGWEAKLVGSTLEGVPTNTITLAELLALNPPPPLLFGELDLAHSPLRGLTAAAIGTAGAALIDLAPSGPGTAWCDFLAAQGFPCAANGIDPNVSTLLDLELAGIHVDIPWSTLPFAAMELGGTPLAQTKLVDFAIAQTPARLFELADLGDPAQFVSCTGCVTLGDAERDGAIVDGPTVADLLADLEDRGTVLAGTTLGDFLLGTLADRDLWPLDALGLSSAPRFSGTGLTVRQTVTFRSAGAAPLVDPQISVVPPPGFLYVPGSSEVIQPTGTAARPIADPVIQAGALTWKLHEIVGPSQVARVRYRLAPGLTLGLFGSRPSALAFDEFGPVSAGPIQNAGPIHVLDAETIPGRANDDALTAPLVESRVRALGHISSATDVDYYRIPVPTGDDCDTSGASAGPAQPGCRIVVKLELAPGAPSVDLDVAVFGPPSDPAEQGLPGRLLSINDTPPVLNTTVDASTENLQDAPVSGLPGRLLPGRLLSASRGTSSELAEFTSTSSDTGFYTVQVYGYNGATSPHVYGLAVSSTPPPPLPACSARSFNQRMLDTATAPVLPADFSSLILVNEPRLAELYTPERAAAVIAEAQLLAAMPEVDGVVYPVNSSPAVVDALAAWDDDQCDLDAANAVSTEIADLVAQLTAGKASFEHVVLVGADDVFPMASVPDLGTIVNEQEYTGTLVDAMGNNHVTTSAAHREFLTDDAYATDDVIDSDGHPVFVPEWVVSRLVETPEQIAATIRGFRLSDGLAEQPPDQTAFVTGYDFIADGSAAIAESLRTSLGPTEVAELDLCDTWERQDVLDHLIGPVPASADPCLAPDPPDPPPDIVSLNGHADHRSFVPAGAQESFDLNEMVTIADLADVTPGRVVFGMGCHFGANLAGDDDWADAFATGVGSEDVARAAVFVGNTGYGYGETTGLGYSELLLKLFADGLDGTKSVGEAFRDAKQQFFLGHMGAYDPLSQKSLQEAVLYGLGQFRLAPEAPPSVTAQSLDAGGGPLEVDPATGFLSRPFDSGLINFQQHTGPLGTHYSGPEGEQLAVQQHPRIPQVTYDVPGDAGHPGAVPVGLLVEGFSSTVEANDPVFAKAEYDIDDGSEPQSTGVFPTAPSAITSLGDENRLLLWPAKFTPTSPPSEKPVTGDLQLRQQVQGRLYFGEASGVAPHIIHVDAHAVDADHVNFRVRVNGGPNEVKRVHVLAGAVAGDLQPAIPGQDDVWTGTLEIPSDVPIDTLVQAVSEGGVATWNNKGTPVTATSLTDGGLDVEIDGPNPVNGWFTESPPDPPASATATGPAGVPLEFSLDGSAFANLTGPVGINATGSHLFQARGYDTSSATTLTGAGIALVDVTPPTAVITNPTPGADYDRGATVAPAFACSDAGSGVLSCTGPPEVDTSTAGPHSYTVTVTDVAGHVSEETVHYVVRDVTKPVVTIREPDEGATYTAGSTVIADYECTDEDGGSGLVSCEGPVADGIAIDTTAGPHMFSVTAIDGDGNSTTETVHYSAQVQGLTFQGFFSPVANPTTVNRVNAGRTVPFKFRVFTAAGVEITSTAGFSSQWVAVSCSSGTEVVPATLAATSASTLKYDTAGHKFVLNAKTDKAWARTCRKFVLTLPDGSTRFALFHFVK